MLTFLAGIGLLWYQEKWRHFKWKSAQFSCQLFFAFPWLLVNGSCFSLLPFSPFLLANGTQSWGEDAHAASRHILWSLSHSPLLPLGNGHTTPVTVVLGCVIGLHLVGGKGYSLRPFLAADQPFQALCFISILPTLFLVPGSPLTLVAHQFWVLEGFCQFSYMAEPAKYSILWRPRSWGGFSYDVTPLVVGTLVLDLTLNGQGVCL